MKRLLLAFTVLATCGFANAATLKIATVAPEASQWMQDMRAGAAEIKERTQGRVQIKFYGGGVMGNDKKVLSQIRIGRLHGGAFTPTALSDLYGDVNLYGLPLVFDSEDEVAFVRSKLDQRIMASEVREMVGFLIQSALDEVRDGAARDAGGRSGADEVIARSRALYASVQESARFHRSSRRSRSSRDCTYQAQRHFRLQPSDRVRPILLLEVRGRRNRPSGRGGTLALPDSAS